MYPASVCFACKQLVVWHNFCTTAGYFYKTSTSAIEFVQKQPDTIDLFRSFELACQCMEMLNKWQHHIHSHQHCPSSVLCLSALQSVSACQHYKQYSRPPCIVLNLCFWFQPGISQSLGFELVTDVPPSRASRCSSACHQLEKARGAMLVGMDVMLPLVQHLHALTCQFKASKQIDNIGLFQVLNEFDR